MLARLGCTLERIPQPLLQRGGLLLGGGQLGVVVLLLLQQGRGFQLAFQVLVSEELLLLALQGLHALPQLVVGVAAERCRGGGGTWNLMLLRHHTRPGPSGGMQGGMYRTYVLVMWAWIPPSSLPQRGRDGQRSVLLLMEWRATKDDAARDVQASRAACRSSEATAPQPGEIVW